ncbi:extracellular beta-glucosidase/cellulase BGL3 precursor [Sphaerosporella brunnea]|uniref:beta-glucosidase n=1 Tax=Sphaerosporella brunnea TaxID=1250544 RepID=A0A5J5EWT0_9PEZI|nr:extracellular beta-glucosidase/cellulase BGL3 precursor [Sphaerosporella brunnea]
MVYFSVVAVFWLLGFETVVCQYSAHSPPYYPSPRIEGSGDWKEAYVKAKAFVDQLTILEKVNITTGTGWQMGNCVGNVGTIPRINFPALCLQDSPLGVRFGTYSSAFPAGLNAAMTWDRSLMRARGYAMGAEFKGKGVNVALGPVAGPLGRHPEGGRNWEGFSPDPVLTGIGMFETISGMQSAGVIATAKHFIGNEQEHFRQVNEAIGYGYDIDESLSSNIDDRTLHELYAWPFADAVRANVGAVMCSYNQVNNSYSCQNSKLLNGILKDEMGFQGFVMSDWQAQHVGVASALAGLDMTMPGDQNFYSGNSYFGGNLTIAVLNGSVPEWRLDDMATRIMAAYFLLDQDKDYPETNFNSWTTDEYGYPNFFSQQDYKRINQDINVQADHYKVIRDIGAKSAVLLKNVGGALPLHKPRQIGLFGSDAGEAEYGPNGCSDRGCNNGTLAMGWGSGSSNFPYLVTPLEAIKARAKQDGTVVQSVLDDYAYAQINATAKVASVCLTFVSSDSGEGYISVDGNEGDRNNLTLWKDGETLINTVASHCNNTVVVIHAGGTVLLESFIDHPNVTAVIFAGLPGQESGNGLADILYGDVNPSGKLPFTMGKSRSDYGVDILYTPNAKVPQEDFSEGLFIDYRHFDKKGIEPRFPFGFGMSYTTFKYSTLYIAKLGFPEGYRPFKGFTTAADNSTSSYDLSEFLPPAGFSSWKVPLFVYPYLNSTSDVKKGTYEDAPEGAYDTAPKAIHPAGGAPGGNPSLYEPVYEVSAIVANTGSCAGEEVVQLYLETGLADDPVIVLRNFEKVFLEKGQSTMVRMQLNRRDLMRWDAATQDWILPTKSMIVKVGSSSRDTPLVGKLY